jgi:hypothetical protein
MLVKWTIRCLKHHRSLSTLLHWGSGCVQLILLKKGSEKAPVWSSFEGCTIAYDENIGVFGLLSTHLEICFRNESFEVYLKPRTRLGNHQPGMEDRGSY